VIRIHFEKTRKRNQGKCTAKPTSEKVPKNAVAEALGIIVQDPPCPS
jgi:hypothetical protein